MAKAKTNNSAPTRAFIFNENTDVCFAGGDSAGDNRFRVTGYSGGIINDHWLWGNVAFDLEGLKFAKKVTPVLEEHFTSSRLGFSTRQEISDKVIVEGEFLDNDNARALKGDMKQGFPMEASLFVPATVVEYVKEGASASVNGLKLKGPGAVFRKAVIKEVSMCVFGADEHTESAACAESDKHKVTFNLIKEADIMAEKEEKLTLETFNAQYPNLHKQVFDKAFAEGREKERALFKEISQACGDDHELAVQCFSAGKTVTEAMKMAAEKAQKKIAELAEENTKLRAAKIDPADAEFSDTADDPAKSEKFDEKTADDEQLKEHFKATAAVRDEFGDVDSYLAYIKREVRKG